MDRTEIKPFNIHKHSKNIEIVAVAVVTGVAWRALGSPVSSPGLSSCRAVGVRQAGGGTLEKGRKTAGTGAISWTKD